MFSRRVLSLPPRLAGMTPWRSTQNRSRVTPISRASTIDRHPPRQVVQDRQAHQRRTDERLVGDRVGQLAELGHQPAGAGDLAVEPVGERGGGEGAPGRDPPAGLVTGAGEQEHGEERHEHDAEAGERIGQVPRRRRRTPRRRRDRVPPERPAAAAGGEPRASAPAWAAWVPRVVPTRGVGSSGRGVTWESTVSSPLTAPRPAGPGLPRAGSTRSTPLLATTSARTRSPTCGTRSPGAQRTSQEPSTSGAWWAARPSATPARASTSSMSTSTTLPIRSSARADVSCSARSTSLVRRRPMVAAPTLPGRPTASVPSSSL